jgi:hypothetical protein
MRYWAYFAGKVVVAVAPLYGIYLLLNAIFPLPLHSKYDFQDLDNSGKTLVHMLSQMFFFLLCAGGLFLIFWDQRRRCRVCLRRLRMPIETGSRGSMLQFGQPRIETICPYGHGTLSEEDAQIAGLANAEWTPHSDDIWHELCAPARDTGQEP